MVVKYISPLNILIRISALIVLVALEWLAITGAIALLNVPNTGICMLGVLALCLSVVVATRIAMFISKPLLNLAINKVKEI